MSLRLGDLPRSVIARIRANGDCWDWIGTRHGPDPRKGSEGYGVAHLGSRTYQAHRFVYEYLVGEIPDGLTLDHLCRRPMCVNPKHLEPVTMKINNLRGNSVSAINARKLRCVNGHEFDSRNTYLLADGRRSCRACNMAAVARYKARKLAGA